MAPPPLVGLAVLIVAELDREVGILLLLLFILLFVPTGLDVSGEGPTLEPVLLLGLLLFVKLIIPSSESDFRNSLRE